MAAQWRRGTRRHIWQVYADVVAPMRQARPVLQIPLVLTPADVLVVEQQAWPIPPHGWQVRIAVVESYRQ